MGIKGIKSVRRTQEEFLNDVRCLVGEEYTVLGTYINTDTKVLMRHENCRNTFEVRPYLFLGKARTRCPHCYGNKKRTTEDFIKLVEKLDRNYQVLGTYKNTDTHIDMKHITCGKTFRMTPACFLKGQRCPHCARSLGVEKIQDFLDKNSITYIREKTYDDLYDIRKLRFDFFIEDLNLLIEYDGEQHFRRKSFGGNINESINEFEKLKTHDAMKNDYCKSKNIMLLRIPFWRYDEIDSILAYLLNKIKSNEDVSQLVSDIFSKNKVYYE